MFWDSGGFKLVLQATESQPEIQGIKKTVGRERKKTEIKRY